MEIIQALFEFRFLQYAFAAGILAAVSCGVVGTFVTVKRMSYIAGAIAHSVLAGLGAANYLATVHDWTWLHPIHGALVAALISAVIIGFTVLRGKQRMDTVLSAIWSIGMSIGILFIFSTPGYNQDIMSYLFGNILMISNQDILNIVFLNIFILGITVVFYKKLFAVCFDEEFARVRGINVDLYFMIIVVLTALTVVVLIQVVGIILVIALLTLPAAAASLVSKRLWKTMALATVLGAVYIIGGLFFSYTPDLPAGAVIILFSAAGYLGIFFFNKVKVSFQRQSRR
ncbi:MAG: metal ABC transporter permease [Spirochaetia bacterium]